MSPIIRKIFVTLLLVLALMVRLDSAFADDDEGDNDPLEPVNRGVFWFNEKADDYVIGPVSKAYHDVVPTRARIAIKSFFNNLRYPMYLVSDIVQLKFGQAGTHTERFVLNSTFGLFGFYDVAADLGVEDKYTDLGVAFGSNGVPAGPYLVIPILGPSNVRDFVGEVGDIALYPTIYPSYFDAEQSVQNSVSYGGNGLNLVQYRASADKAIRSAKEASLDYYLFIRNAYGQLREGYINGGPDEDEQSSPVSKNP